MEFHFYSFRIETVVGKLPMAFSWTTRRVTQRFRAARVSVSSIRKASSNGATKFRIRRACVSDELADARNKLSNRNAICDPTMPCGFWLIGNASSPRIDYDRIAQMVRPLHARKDAEWDSSKSRLPYSEWNIDWKTILSVCVCVCSLLMILLFLSILYIKVDSSQWSSLHEFHK